MTASHNPNRPAVTLIEVLVAIFVMGIGLICLLTLFPLGAMRMAAAFKDERASQAANNARTIAAGMNLRADTKVEPYFKDKDKDNGPGTFFPDDNDPSYPVFVDPYGVPFNRKLGANIARIEPKFASPYTSSKFAYFSLLDDVTFQRGFGVPKLFGPRIEREMLYTWAYLLQRPRFADPSVVNATACVFQRRPKAGPLDTEYPNATSSSVIMNPADNTITISYTGDAPNIQAGMWILDGTIKVSSNKAGCKYALGNFYRITGVRDATGGLALDLQTPLQGYNAASAGQVVMLEGLVEVFDLGPGR